MDDLAKLETQAEQYTLDGDAQAAVKCFYDLVVQHARSKNFTKAEAMRERLMAVDDMALTEIIKTAEIIETEKSGAIDPDHIQVFKALFDTLTDEETNALYFAQQPLTLETGDVLYRQGDINTRLYFILRGHLKLYFSREGKDNLITTLEPGSVAGQDSFFATTTCTTSLSVQSQAELQVIERDHIEGWKESHPALEAKLKKFCHAQDVGSLVTTKGLERRMSRRIKVEGAVVAQLLDPSQRLLGKPFHGDMADISNTGLSFCIKATDKSARMLLGRQLKVKSTLNVGGKQQGVERTGITVAVTPLFFGDFSIHIKFNHPLKSR
jgi:CRP/FNR family transcriptional regulator, cyclic AMP receptor protein